MPGSIAIADVEAFHFVPAPRQDVGGDEKLADWQAGEGATVGVGLDGLGPPTCPPGWAARMGRRRVASGGRRSGFVALRRDKSGGRR
jgi:hypothetical protein